MLHGWVSSNEREARALRDARPVRLVNISRAGFQGDVHLDWQDLPRDSYIHGCLSFARRLRHLRCRGELVGH